MKIFQENESVDLQLVMFSQNRNQPILTEFRGCFPHAVKMLQIIFQSVNQKLLSLGLSIFASFFYSFESILGQKVNNQRR